MATVSHPTGIVFSQVFLYLAEQSLDIILLRMVWISRNNVVFLLWWLISSNVLLADPLPVIKFVENKNQWPSHIQFSARVPGGRMFIQPGGFSYYFLDEQKMQALHEHTHDQNNESGGTFQDDQMIDGIAINVDFIGSNKQLLPKPFGKSREYYNYFLGDDSCRWASNVFAYNGFLYPDVYHGVDLKVYAAGASVKYDFVVAPDADPGQVLIAYNGAESLEINGDGDFLVGTPFGDIIEKKPIAYQDIDGIKTFVACHYVLRGGRLSFAFDNGYDPCYELVIDPLLIFSTYSGSTADNWGSTATPGENGSLYSAGVTSLINAGGTFPATVGAFQVNYGGLYDIGILKYDSAGHQLLYATYLGGSESESPHSLVMNSSEELVVLGTTSSSNFPTSAGAFDRTFNGGTFAGNVIVYDHGSDIFVARISKDGSQLLASTLLGGNQNDGLNPSSGALTKNYGDQLRGDVITDKEDNIYISTVTASSNFPAINGFDLTYHGGPTDALLLKLNPALSEILWSTFLGGAGTDASHTLKFNKAGDVLIAGGTTSADFPVTGNAYQQQIGGDADGWIARISAAGDVIYDATFTGTSSFDQIYFLDLNEDDEVYVYGQTSGDFPITAGVYNNPNSGQFIQKFDASLTTLIFSTVFGSGRGIPDISPTAFIVNECNNLYMAGWGGAINARQGFWQSSTVGMPITFDAYQKTTSGSDFYFMVLTDDGSQFLYGTYLGGAQSRTHVDGGTSRFDKSGIVYHAVCSGCVSDNATGHATSDFPTTIGVWSRTNNSLNCNNAAFKFDLSSLRARIQSNSIALDMPGLNKICIPDTIVFQNRSVGGEIFEWDLGDGTSITKLDTGMILHAYSTIGKYTVWLKAIDQGTCKVKDSTSIKVDVFIALTEVQDDDAMCLGSPYTLQASGGAKYAWRSEDGSFQSSLATPVVSPKDTMRYFITITEATGCIQKDTVQLAVIPLIEPAFEIDRNAECSERPTISVRNTSDSLRAGDRLFFDFGDGTTSDGEEEMHDYENDGLYNVKLIGVREFCVTEKVVSMPVFKLLIPNIITPGLQDSSNDRFTIQFGDLPGTTPADYGFKTSIIVYNRWGKKVYESSDYKFDWQGEGLAAGIYFYEVSVDNHATCKSWVQVVK
ncbi:MAG: PKD domain-containing protein [Cyclobacteriaceae bacterium]|nr:PKD domain-containing protein [Cyclobacteriaceae bacterium]